MKKSNIVWAAFGCVLMGAAAWAQTSPAPAAADVLRQARVYLFEFRAGQYDVAPKYVAMMQDAVKASPENADLWYNLGFAYLAQAAGTMLMGGKPADAMVAAQQGPKALERALQVNPDHAEALAVHGGMQASMGALMHAPQMAAKGAAEMNRAVELAPNSARARLQRAFSGLTLPDELRNHAAEGEDLDFLIQLADGSQPGDYIHIMRGDLYFELGQTDLARDQYEIAGKAPSPAATEAKARLAALAQGGVAMTDIRKLRSAAGAQCAMCHSR